MDVQYKCISFDVSTVWHGNISCHVSCHTCPIHVSTMDVTVGVFVRGSKGRCQSIKFAVMASCLVVGSVVVTTRGLLALSDGIA